MHPTVTSDLGRGSVGAEVPWTRVLSAQLVLSLGAELLVAVAMLD